jgi:hypothetical protein
MLKFAPHHIRDARQGRSLRARIVYGSDNHRARVVYSELVRPSPVKSSSRNVGFFAKCEVGHIPVTLSQALENVFQSRLNRHSLGRSNSGTKDGPKQ